MELHLGTTTLFLPFGSALSDAVSLTYRQTGIKRSPSKKDIFFKKLNTVSPVLN
jgi:hypothetical protein